MDKEKAPRKKSTDKFAGPWPPPPPDPLAELPPAFRRLSGFHERQAAFEQTLAATIRAECAADHDGGQRAASLTAECDEYIQPLLARTGPSISAALVTEGAMDQLDKLHGILGQLLDMQAQNYRLRRSTRDVETLIELKRSQMRRSDEILLANSDVKDEDNDLEMEYNDALLRTILAAGNSATSKRSVSKKQRMRSKSVINPPDERSLGGLLLGDAKPQSFASPHHHHQSTYPLRRQSAITDIKAKVSKWTKVKAAFKWERANPSLNENGKSTDSGIGLSPLNTEVARYLCVPTLPVACGSGSSADSVLSGGGGGGGGGTGSSQPATPGTMSSASSMDDVRTVPEDYLAAGCPQTAASASSSPTPRHRKLPQTTHCPTLMLTAPPPSSPASFPPTASTTAPTATSVPSQPSSGAGSFELPTPPPPLAAPPRATGAAAGGRGSTRKSKLVHSGDIACVPEGLPLDIATLPRGRPPPSPLNLNSRQTSHPDSSDTDQLDPRAASPPFGRRTSKNRRATLAGRNASAPNSPSQQFEFFGGEFDSEDLSSGDFSEPCTPYTAKISPKASLVLQQQDEINRKYHELQQQISLEFQLKQREWERIRNLSMAAGNVPYSQQSDDYSSGKELSKSPSTPKPIEENLTADFKKKLQEWRIKQSQSNTSVKDMQTSSTSPTKEADKKIDWNLWKTGQIKLEGQGLKQMPDEKDLPEDFKRKFDEWKRIKAPGGSSTSADSQAAANKRLSLKGSSPAKCDSGSAKKLKSSADDLAKSQSAGEREKLFRLKSLAEPKPAKEVVVQTTKGALKFEGISRKFTQKLYEWEKARGIGPESSTFALLHPGYRPLVVGSGELEASTASSSAAAAVAQPKKPTAATMGRSMSMDSMSPHASVPSIVSHQPSSLSLNNVDDIVDTKSLTGGRCGGGAGGGGVRGNGGGEGGGVKAGMFGSSDSDLDLEGDDDDEYEEEDGGSRRRQSRDSKAPDDDEEPEAVIVEVEDDYVETADSLFTATPMIEKQTPIYRYEQHRKEFYAGNKEAVFVGECKPTIAPATSKALKDATRMVTSFREVRHGFSENVEHVQRVLVSLIDTVPALKTSLQGNSDRLRESVDVIQNLAKNVIDKLTELEQSASSKEDLDAKMTAIDGQLGILRKALNFVCKHTASRKTSRNDDVPAISITCEDPTPSSTSAAEQRNVAVVSLAPIVFQGQVVINQVQVHRAPPVSSELELSEDVGRHSDCDSGNKNTTTDTTASSAPAGGQPSSEPETSTAAATSATVTRNPSNAAGSSSSGGGAKRKVKLRRLGSRQNSKTESDSDEEGANVVPDACSRRLKRKTSRAKRLTESASLDKADECVSIVTPTVSAPVEDVVFTLKLKPGHPIEQTAEIITPLAPLDADDPLEVLEHLPGDDEFIVSSNVFVRTKRRLYTPCADQPGAVIGQDIDTSTTSADSADATSQSLPPLRLVTNLPPLPQSPGQQRRQQSAGKDPASPAIRLMIAKYNQRLCAADRRNSSPLQDSPSGGSPTAWRSPVLERRCRPSASPPTTSAITKSSSAGQMGRVLRICETNNTSSTDGTTAVAQLLKGVLKSSSAGLLTSADGWTASVPLSVRPDQENDEDDDVPLGCRTTLASDSMRRLSVSRSEAAETLQRSRTSSAERTEGVFRKHATPGKVMTPSVVQRKMRAHGAEGSAGESATAAEASGHGEENKGRTNPEDDNGDSDVNRATLTNTLPRITRKYDAAKPPSPRLTARRPVKLSLDLNLRSPRSGSAVPLTAHGVDGSTTAPVIGSSASAAAAAAAAALSERALKLKRAKEEFLKMSAGYRSAVQYQETEVIWRKNRLSVGGSGVDDDDDDDDNATASNNNGTHRLKPTPDDLQITKSASVGMIHEKSATMGRRRPSDAPSSSGGASLPRGHTTRPSKSQGAIVTATSTPATTPTTPSTTSSKFGGFTTLAQKLRLVKSGSRSKELNTVTKLCRQSLMVDIPVAAADEPCGNNGSATTAAAAASAAAAAEATTSSVRKSGSTQTMGGLGSLLFRRQERAAKLKKSKSIGQLDGSG